MWSGRQTLNETGSITNPRSQPDARLFPPFVLLILASLSAFGQTRLSESVTVPCAVFEFNQGLVVEGVAKNSEGDKAGLAEGDVILRWTLGEAKGDIGSPFDLSEIEEEQEPRGRVTLEGTRGSDEETWVMGYDKWGIKTRPSLPSALLAIYMEGQELAKEDKFHEAAERWRAAVAEGQKYQCSWLSPWFLLQAAETLNNVGQWEDSESFYQEAIRQAAGASPIVRVQLLRALSRASGN